MKIFHVIIGLNAGGAELMLSRLIKSQLTFCDVQHSVISLTDEGVVGSMLTEHGIKVYSLGMSSIFMGPSVFFKLRSLLKEQQPDIIHTWMYHADLLGGLAARSIGLRRVIWCIRSTDISKGGSKITLLIRKLCAWLSGWLPYKIVCAADASRIVHEAVGYQANKMLVIPNGFDPDKLVVSNTAGLTLRKELGIDPSDMLVISVGRFNPVKDHKTFIAAAGKIAAKFNNVKFLLVGRDLQSTNAALMQMITETNEADMFFLLGERNDVVSCLKASNIFCLHSVTEGFPNVLGEAMAAGLPCVTTDVGDAAFLLNNSHWVVPAESPELLAQKIVELLKLSSEDRIKLGKYNALLKARTL
ncbi:MAG: glycosyltransferase, partial [Paraglaciecola sp.]|nr:glycosyltransferase [Paraglaciecola sp.]